MKLQDYYNLLKENEYKIPIIDRITQRHPGYGTELGWSSYTGGMVDSGNWHIEKLLSIPLNTLTFQEERWKREDEEAAQRMAEYNKLSLSERMAMEKQSWLNFQTAMENKIMWGK